MKVDEDDGRAEVVNGDLHRPFALAGRRGYLVGFMDGSFPDLGHHIPGEMGGLWAPPVKLADGYWFGVRRAGSDEEWQWLHGATTREFTMAPGRAIAVHEVVVADAPLPVTATTFVAGHEPAVLTTVEVGNPTNRPLELELCWLVRFELRGAWWSQWPDRPDVVEYDEATGSAVARDAMTPAWGACMVADRRPIAFTGGADLWGPERTGSVKGTDHRPEGILRNPDDLLGEGVSGQLVYALSVPAGGTERLETVVCGSHEFDDEAVAHTRDLPARRDQLLADKLAAQQVLRRRSPRVVAPRADVGRIVDGSVQCLDLLTQDIPGVGTGIMAGLPGFAWFFGCDTYYSVGGLLVANQPETVLSSLRMLADHARRQRGRVPHEIVQTGELFNPGNQIETGEFATSVERAYRWTGDRDFLAEVYPVVVEGIFTFLLQDSDPDGTLLPEGPGILELSSAHRGRKLDVAAGLYQGLESLAYLAGVMGDEATRSRCEQTAARVREAIEQHFWDPEQQQYVWRIEHDLTLCPGEPPHGFVTLEFGVVRDAERAARLFQTVEQPPFTRERGLLVPGSDRLVMPVQNAILALAEFRYGRVDEGLRYVDFCGAEYAHYMPWAIPEFIGHDSCFVQAWSSATYVWLAVQGFFRLDPDPVSRVVRVQPQLPSSWPSLEVRNLVLWGTGYDLRLERTSNGTVAFTAVRSDGVDASSGDGAVTFQVLTPTDVPVRFV